MERPGIRAAMGKTLLGICAGLCAAAGLLQAGTVTIGVPESDNIYPFGLSTAGTNSYVGEYQQRYDSSLFEPMYIQSISFSSRATVNRSATYVLSVGLGTTARETDVNYSGFENTFTTVYSGALLANLTATQYDFDLTISLATPYFYNPSSGNLLLDVTMTSATTTPNAETISFEFQVNSAPMARVFNLNGSGAYSGREQGLMTQITYSTVPEPSSCVLIGVGVLVIGWAARRRWSHFANFHLPAASRGAEEERKPSSSPLPSQ